MKSLRPLFVACVLIGLTGCAATDSIFTPTSTPTNTNTNTDTIPPGGPRVETRTRG